EPHDQHGRDAHVTNKEKTGVNIGAKAVNPVNGREIPIFISDYVLMAYGTGAIMAVPAHDERDFAFATKFDLPILPVINPDIEAIKALHNLDQDNRDGLTPDQIHLEIMEGKRCWTGPGRAINSANDEISLDGLDVVEA